MSGSGYTYTASSRIPVRPLSYENKDLALPKELLIDYNANRIYICNISGEIIDITDLLSSEINSKINDFVTNDEMKDAIMGMGIKLPDGTTVRFDKNIEVVFNTLYGIENEDIPSINENISNILKAIDKIPQPARQETDLGDGMAIENVPIGASFSKATVGKNIGYYALEDHIHYPGEAASVDWSGVRNKPSSFTPSTHAHSEYLSKSGNGAITEGNIIFDNNCGIDGLTTDGKRQNIARVDIDNFVTIGTIGSYVSIEGILLIDSDNYGTEDPVAKNIPGITGRIYLQLI